MAAADDDDFIGVNAPNNRMASTSIQQQQQQQPNDKARKQIPLIISLALVSCLVSSFILVGMLPSPNAFMDNDADAPRRSVGVDHDMASVTHRKHHKKQKIRKRPELQPPSPATDERAVRRKEIANAHKSTNANAEADAETRRNSNSQEQQNHSTPNIENQSLPSTTTATSEEPIYPRLIHILETRFMQNQPNLIELAKARLHLLRTICLPTVLHQTAWGDFFWIIRTDPDLHPTIKSELVTMLEESNALIHVDEDGIEHALTYVIGSNDNYIVPNSTVISPSVRPFDIQAMLSTTLSNNHTLFAGNATDMQNLLNEISLPRFANDIVLWTRLDADDGLNTRYMEYIQEQAIRYFVPELYGREIVKLIPENYLQERMERLRKMVQGRQQRQKEKNEKQQQQQPSEKAEEEEPIEGDVDDDDESDITITDDTTNDTNATTEVQLIPNTFTPPQWTYWCAGKNIDWFLTDPIHDPLHNNGTVYPVIHANVCVTPGVTVAIHGSFDPMRVPRLDHDKIISYLRPRGGRLCSRSGLSVFDISTNVEKSAIERIDEDDGSCFHMVHVGISALRSRTPTSAGMLGVMPDNIQKEIMKSNPKLTELMWHAMKNEFRILNRNLLKTNAYFAEHVYDIAEENARGQCTAGHSCKSSSKDLLQQFADLASERGGGYDVVDGMIRITEKNSNR
ncbi:hypothetical protein ACHAXH_003750 [Discostella pseudostelligera]